ncbi:ROK family protein [Cohnella zeiphila]|uniref:ROK family protein n=1 Tax=Cohnella zeiphila TaxID=2761120 RepID=A0A7X0SRE8_9BACL|nr:ROK family protein [Cohnella zeiphila]MBB6734777.1 ROK family protein [Cohnella zeiphila]
METSLILAFDVGGTQIKAGALVGGELIEATVSHYPSHADRSAKEIAGHFAAIAADLVAKSGTASLPVGGIGMAFPGPFDYENGISLIRGLGKFESLYELNVGKLLEAEIRRNEALVGRLAPTFEVHFENDAALFGLGEAAYGEAAGASRAICLTIGTGLGSCYLMRGRWVKHGDGVPENGWLYTTPFREGMADDYVSRRGILSLAREFGLDLDGRDVHDFARQAIAGDADAKRLFAAFGRRMADILAPALNAFAPDTIVIGGQISKSGSLFVPAFEEGLGFPVEAKLSADTLDSTFKGIYQFVTAKKSVEALSFRILNK